MNVKRDLKITYLIAGIVLIGLIGWNFYFEDEFDPFREPYSGGDFTERQVESVGVDSNDSQDDMNTNDATAEPQVEIYGVSSLHPLAADVGMQIIEDGGNAIDAAVAVSFMLNVVEPYGSGIGGGGQMLYHDPEEGAVSYDYREAAPESEERPERGVAVPGLVKGMDSIHENHGELSWEELLAPAIETAEEGFQVGEIFNQQTSSSVRYLQLDEQQSELFFPGGQVLAVNDHLVQNELAETLRLIQENRSDGFYSGPVGESLQEELDFTAEDLEAYEPQLSDPVEAEIGNQVVYGGSSPSSGTVVLQALKMAERIDLTEMFPEENIPENLAFGDLVNHEELHHVYTHLINEITKITYNDRLDTLGDPQYDQIDHEVLTSEAHIDDLFDEISYDEITEADTSTLFDSPAEEGDSRHTTHFVIVDKEGRMVSATHSLGEFYGSGRYINGFFLNNQMENFSPNDESLNRYEPGKRPRSFVSPLIFEQSGQPILGIGTPGGRRIPAMLFQTIMQYQHAFNEDDERVSLQQAIEAPRFYNEEEVIYVEEALPEETAQRLRDMGYSVIGHDSPLFYGGIQGLGVILNENGETQGMYGGGDPRRNGSWQIEGGSEE
ncbi:gamma-glutamyltranspeptidase/glutathione hydrolase [Virgibacillus natechei]|uniref:Gamma-glutamyltranspeptidase/glutathione hydrolase n=1 Tax=Virgibacillus natechei TaxID=1216297 RepID=A0ABS4IG78_9BACI|nr:gamma-glutamyltransferase [Virgibacillus natechei]MBP1969461.1 gamma-glutamyltranspeptidase/glutathione hydrolase [Virgibacillus natechei]UZD11831.1 gamma-glutamyltransferase family protein [Virgibacillus natechei]